MRILPLAVIVGAFALAPCVSAQDSPTSKPPYTSEAMLQRITGGGAATADRAEAMSCVLPDQTEHAVNTIVTVDGRTIRCVAVLDQNFERRGETWTPGSKPAYTSEAMLRRVAGGRASTPRSVEAITCVLPDKTEQAVHTTVTVDGLTYQCVEVLDRNLERRGVAWTPLPPGP